MSTTKYRVKVPGGLSPSWVVQFLGVDGKPGTCLGCRESQAAEVTLDEAFELASKYRGQIQPVEVAA